MKRIIFGTAGLIFFALSASATVIRVPQDQPTIQAGINAAVSGDTVLVGPGTYTENINFNGKNVALKSQGGRDFTVLKPAARDTAIISIISGEGPPTTIEGFTITGAYPTKGAVYIFNSGATIRNNLFVDDTTSLSEGAGGVTSFGSITVVESNIFNRMVQINGFGAYGGAIHVRGGQSMTRRNLILNTQGGVGTIRYVDGAQGEIINNTLDSNNTIHGILIQSGPVFVKNNIVTNTSNQGGIYAGPGVTDYNDCYANPVNFFNQGPNDISADPLYNVYHRLSTGSPCINTGDPSIPVPTGGGTRVDMGAFEFSQIVLISPADDASVRARKPQLIWAGLNDSTTSFTYRVVIDIVSNFSSADSSPVLTDTTWKLENKLSFGQTYYWKVIAVSDSVDTIFSGVNSFSVSQPQFDLFRPSANSQVRLRQPTFIWQSVKDTNIPDSFKYYRVILSKSGFSVADTSPVTLDTTWKIPYKLDLNQTYFWKVQAVSDSGDTVYSNAVQSFSVTPPLLSLASPTNSSRVLVKQPTFNWGAMRDTSISDIFSYRVIYAKNPSFTGATSSPILTDTFWQAPAPLDIATTYYWKVLAFYSSTNDTVLPIQNFSFLLAPTKLVVPDDRPTIQQAIDISLNGDTVLVKPGTYTQNILFKGKRIKLMSEGGPAVTTIAKLVDGFELVNFSNGEDSTAVLSGFTLTGARLVPSGAAVNIINSSPIIENNYIIDNTGDAAVILADGGSPKIRRCLIVRDSDDAAIRFFNSSGGEVINCTISDNFGDGIRVQAGLPSRITNNIIVANTGHGIRSMWGSNTNSTITYNDIFANNRGIYFATIPGEGNIYMDPQYRGGNPFDYHLRSLSPCVDSGDPAFPVPPGGGARVDMGAFEHISVLAGDLNLDDLLTAADVVLELNCVFSGTGDCPLALADLNCDNILTASDVIILINDVFLGVAPPCTEAPGTFSGGLKF